MTALARLLIGPAIGAVLLLDKVAYRRGRAIETYETPAEWVGEETRPSAAVGHGGTAGSPTQAPAAVPAPSSPPPVGAGPIPPPGRPPKRGRHASGRVLIGPWAKPVGVIR